MEAEVPIQKKKYSVLKAAAEQLQLEESQSSSNAFAVAAAEVGVEQGIILGDRVGHDGHQGDEITAAAENFIKRKHTADSGALELLSSMGVNESELTAQKSGAALDEEAANSLMISAGVTSSSEEAALEMFEIMGIKPKPVDDVEADALNLLATVGFNPTDTNIDKDALDLMKEVSKSNTLSERERYLTRQNARNSGRYDKDTLRLSHLSIVSEPSNVSKLLRSSDNKPWGRHLSDKFSTYTEEQLFRSMFKTKPLLGDGKLAKNKTLRASQDKIQSIVSRLSTPKENNSIEKEAHRILLLTSQGKKRAQNKQYSTLDDTRHCTFKVKLKSRYNSEA